jgi:hypothetical protein
MGLLDRQQEQAAEKLEAARLAIGRLVEQGLLDANAATRQLLALDLELARQRKPGAPPAPEDPAP